MFELENKTHLLIIKMMIKNIHCHFCTKSHYPFAIIHKGERDLIKWNQGEIVNFSHDVGGVVLGTSSKNQVM